ncbi:SMP-30/gluconolactonase/LRE family protein [Falsiroseomonas bella]|uniref:SMP-30/gluconolactonase/LRE family protein n=1 Tax=Falsiroseomonas bella TaxID=2184016 RepID=UPI001E2A0293|nr:SMP-30/gluconolactonase/LRE family protein [Falsiroseomonas bella]
MATPRAKPASRPTPPQPDSATQGTQALVRALRLLDIVATQGPLRTAAIAEQAGLPRGTVHRMLGALSEAGLLRQDSEEGSWRLGLKVFEMAHRVWDSLDLRGAAEPELARLAADSGETARLALLDGDGCVYVDQREAARSGVRLGNGIGARAPLHASACGKAMLAHLPPPERRRRIRSVSLTPLTAATITDPAAFQRDLDLVKARGYAVSREESTEGVAAVAAPVVDHLGEPIAAVCVLGPSFRLPPDRLHALGREVIEAARRISGNAGHVEMSIATTRPSAPPSPGVRCAIEARPFLGEGPVWLADAQRLLWVDILAPAVHLSDVARGEDRALPVGELVGAVVPRTKGGFVAAMGNSFRALDLEAGVTGTLCVAEPDKPGNRFNDAKCDRAGRLFAGTMAIDAGPGQGTLWRLDPDLRLTAVETGLHISNGLGWSPDNRIFYFTDTGTRTVYAYDYDLATGAATSKRPFVTFAGPAKPDGLAVDAEGFVWIALWDGWGVARHAPDGTLDRFVSLPVPRPSSVCFGGKDLRTLFVTSARVRLSAAQLAEAPLSGSVFAFEPGVAGAPVGAFGG